MSLWSCVDQYAAVNPGVVEEVKLIVLYKIARWVTAHSTTNSPVNLKSTFHGNRNWCFSKQISYYVYLFGKNTRDISRHNRPLLLCIVRARTHTRLTALCPGLPGWARTRKVKPIWILLKQETVSGSGISWAICKCASRSRQITLPGPHHSVILQAGCPSCRPTNSVKALKA